MPAEYFEPLDRPLGALQAHPNYHQAYAAVKRKAEQVVGARVAAFGLLLALSQEDVHKMHRHHAYALFVRVQEPYHPVPTLGLRLTLSL